MIVLLLPFPRHPSLKRFCAGAGGERRGGVSVCACVVGEVGSIGADICGSLVGFVVGADAVGRRLVKMVFLVLEPVLMLLVRLAMWALVLVGACGAVGRGPAGVMGDGIDVGGV